MKLFTSSAFALILAATPLGVCAGEPSFTYLDGQYYFGGFMPQCISANGRYVAGSSFVGVGFISDWQEQNTLLCHGQNGNPFAGAFAYVTDEGVGLAASLIDFRTGESLRTGAGAYVDMMTEDGSIMVGMTPRKEYSDFGSPHNIEYQACWWEDGEMHLLPVPTEEELGYYYLRTRARCISADGSVILGEIIDRLYQLPMILWHRQPDGSYELDAVCMDYFSDIKYNEGFYRQYVTFHGHALSRNGKWVAMTLRDAPEYMKPAVDPLRVALYNVETGEIVDAVVTDELREASTPHYFIYYNGIADDGTIVGYYENSFGGESAFIMYPEDMVLRNFTDAFDSIGQFADFDEKGLNRVSSITPDGRYITGYGWIDDYLGYVFFTGADANDGSSVESIGADIAGEPEYYDISGRRLPAPVRGINILRHPDGTSEKILR